MKPENTCHKTVSGMMALFNQRFLDTAVPSRSPPSLDPYAAAFTMYPKWLVFVLTLLSCLVFMASAAPVVGGGTPPVKRLKQFQLRRPSARDSIVARA